MDWEETCNHESSGEGGHGRPKRSGPPYTRPRCSRAGEAVLLTWLCTCRALLASTANPGSGICARPHVERTNRKPRSGTASLAS